jgi:SPP1 gp7 family putative phage head morphogenesis protein
LDPQSRTPVRRAAFDLIFDLGQFKGTFLAQMRGAALNALQTAGEQVLAELKQDDAWTMPQLEAIQFIRDRENKLAGVADNVHDRIKQVLETGLNEGQTLREIAAAVRGEFNQISERRAKVIASTETAAAFGEGRHQAMKSAGIQWKQWLTSGNANVRAAHRAMQGATVPINEMFTVIDPKSGEVDTVKHPADSNGAPWNVINCHCVEIAVASGPQGVVEPSV